MPWWRGACLLVEDTQRWRAVITEAKITAN
jgi:hypothetical protein